jgi:hypothetical protein
MGSGLLGTELDYPIDICRVTKGLTRRTLVTSSYKLTKLVLQNHVKYFG